MSLLSATELSYLKRRLGRHPSDAELQIVAAEWSEHCSYKSSKKHILRMPTSGRNVIVGSGYDAGVIAIGDDLVLTIRIESHNHPSVIEPYGGAATGVGGVVRDILSTGSRPIALMNSLHFGSIKGDNQKVNQHSRWLLKNVVRGISDYGNCIGIPTVGGEVEFDRSFDNYCLVDVVCIGLSKNNRIVPNTAETGDLLLLVGGSTGRDGIHGAVFASTELVHENRSAVQIPDPFLKKILIEATLEATEKGYIDAMKDLGGGGLACCLSETSHNLQKGFDIDLSCVRLREKGMSPIEILISESQERMLLIVSKENRESLEDIFRKYGVGYSVIGQVGSASSNIRIRHNSKVIADISSDIVVCAPLLDRRSRFPSYLKNVKRLGEVNSPKDLTPILLVLLSNPNVCNRSWIYEQYDSEVGLRTVFKPGHGDSSVLRLDNGKYVALTIDGNCRHCYLDPYYGTLGCMSEAVRNITCSGASPIGIVDHLQYGSPENPEVFWSFRQAVAAITDYCKSFKIPVVGGKVSFYNEINDIPIKPSPVIGAIGIGDDIRKVRRAHLKPGCTIFVIGKTKEELGGSEYYLSCHNTESGQVPRVDLKEDRKNALAISHVISNDAVEGVHDCSKGGLAVALAEMALNGDTGYDVDISLASNGCKDTDSILFSESNSRYLVATENPKELLELLSSFDKTVSCSRIGKAAASLSSKKVVYRRGTDVVIELGLEKLRDAFNSFNTGMSN